MNRRLGTALLCTTVAAAAQPAACTDFYEHVNADWLASTVLPPDRARIGSFDELRIANDRLLERVLTRLVAEPARQDTPGLKLLAAWYAGGLDDAVAERAGLKAAQPWLDRVAALRAAGDLPALMGELARHRIEAPFAVWVSADVQDTRRHVLNLNQDGLGLPDRDDYFKHDETSRRLQTAYRRHAARLLALAGAPHDAATLDTLMALETELARASMTRVERRDPQATNNRYTIAGLRTLAPGFDWVAWFQATGIGADERELVLGQPLFAQAVGRLTASAPLPAWQSYLRVRLLDALAPWLHAGFRQTHFGYHEGVQRGLKTPPARHEQLVRLIGGPTGWEPLSQTLGELFVREAFSPRAQQRAGQLIEDVRSAMRTRIRGLPWMTEATKQRALAKLDAMAPQVGAPQRWPDYDGLQLDPLDPAGNQLRVNAWGFARGVADLAQPVDRFRWQTSPHIVNAFAGSLNRIVFPAGILQPPFFDAEGDDAANYGGIGMVIGHEITHHFDDRGRQYDALGNLADWWAPEDAAAYRARADRVVALYGGYEPLPGLRINGRQMLGENISDLGGLQIAYDAYRLSLARQPAPVIAGRTPEQRFFVANAVVWRTQQRAEALEQQIRTGQHSPGPYRVRGPMANMPAFAAAFGCRPGDAMVAADPVAVW
jgi:predicted metalloendopeptidase